MKTGENDLNAMQTLVHKPHCCRKETAGGLGSLHI